MNFYDMEIFDRFIFLNKTKNERELSDLELYDYKWIGDYIYNSPIVLDQYRRYESYKFNQPDKSYNQLIKEYFNK